VQTEPTGQPAQPVEDEGFEEFDYAGERVRLARNDRHYLMTLGLDAYERLRASQDVSQDGQAPQQVTPPQGQDEEHPIFAEVRNLKQELGKIRSEARKQEVIRGAEVAIEANEFLSGWAKKQPAEKKPLMAEVIQFQAAHPRMSYENAAKAVEKRWSARFKANLNEYTKGKIESAGRRVETGGQFPVQTPKFGRKELQNGAIKRAAIERAERYAQAQR